MENDEIKQLKADLMQENQVITEIIEQQEEFLSYLKSIRYKNENLVDDIIEEFKEIMI